MTAPRAFTPLQRRKGQAQAQLNRRKSATKIVLSEELPGGGQPPTNLDEAVSLQAWVSVAVATGKVDPRTANEITRACGNLRGLLKERDAVRRLAELESQLAELKKGATP